MSPRKSRHVGAVVAVLLSCLAFGLAGCGSSSSSSGASGSTGQVHFAKTKFVLHAGLAFGAFHHWIYKPARAGDFRHPFSHKLTIIKAALAAGFVYHELKLALHDAQSSPTLSKLVSPITALENRIHGLGSEVKSGGPSAAALSQDNSSVGSIEKGSATAGQPINEQTPAAP